MTNIKNIIITILTISLCIGIYVYNNPRVDFNKEDEGGIAFYKGTWAEVLTKAKQENKLIFLDIYATWCGPCKKLKKYTFASKKTGLYFNTHFINISLDGEEGAGAALATFYEITNYPSLLFINGEGKVVSRTDGYMGDKELINYGKLALQKP